MEKPVLDLEEKSIKDYYTTKENSQKAKSISFSAFLVSIFIYISSFYVFHLSPSTLFSDTKFWFFVSNTIILIIAADSGAFSSSKPKLDLHEQNLINSRPRSTSPFVPPSPENGAKNEPEPSVETPLEEKQIISPKSELSLEIVPKTDSEASCEISAETKPDIGQQGEAEAYNKKKVEPRYRRSKSEKATTAATDKNKKILSRAETDKLCLSDEENEFSDSVEASPEENEYSAMSDEELNKRVEEFIQRFNRQIRLQETRNFGANSENDI